MFSMAASLSSLWRIQQQQGGLLLDEFQPPRSKGSSQMPVWTPVFEPHHLLPMGCLVGLMPATHHAEILQTG